MKMSRLLLGMNSYMSSLSSPPMPQPKSLTSFLSWSFAISMISFLNSSAPCHDFLDSLLTAIYFPFGSTPWKALIWIFTHQKKASRPMKLNQLGHLTRRGVTLKTVPNPPCPSLFESKKLSVAALTVAKSMKGNSWGPSKLPSCIIATVVGVANSCNSVCWLFSSSTRQEI